MFHYTILSKLTKLTDSDAVFVVLSQKRQYCVKLQRQVFIGQCVYRKQNKNQIKNKIFFRPTYPNFFFAKEAGHRTIFCSGLTAGNISVSQHILSDIPFTCWYCNWSQASRCYFIVIMIMAKNSKLNKMSQIYTHEYVVMYRLDIGPKLCRMNSKIPGLYIYIFARHSVHITLFILVHLILHM